MVRLTDQQIFDLISEQKDIDYNIRDEIKFKSKRGHKEFHLNVTGIGGSAYLIILRQSIANIFDFSVILTYEIPESNYRFRLIRYNGKNHSHTNQIENQTFYSYHIHRASERYQELGMREDAFAEPTNRYSDLYGAIECMLKDCNFIIKSENLDQLSLKI